MAAVEMESRKVRNLDLWAEEHAHLVEWHIAETSRLRFVGDWHREQAEKLRTAPPREMVDAAQTDAVAVEIGRLVEWHMTQSNEALRSIERHRGRAANLQSEARDK